MKKQLLALGAFLVMGFSALPSLAGCSCQMHSYQPMAAPCCPAAPITCCPAPAPCCPAPAPCCPKVVRPCPCVEAMPCPAAPIQSPCCNTPTYNDCSD